MKKIRGDLTRAAKIDAIVSELERTKAEAERIGAEWIYLYRCGNCGTDIDRNDKYCRCCGRVLDWSKAVKGV